MTITWHELATTYDDPAPEEESLFEAQAGDWTLRTIFDTLKGRWAWQAHHRDGTLHDGHADTLAAAQDAAEVAAGAYHQLATRLHHHMLWSEQGTDTMFG